MYAVFLASVYSCAIFCKSKSVINHPSCEIDRVLGLRIFIDTQLNLQDSSFVVTITCCTEGNCLQKKGLESPTIFKTSDSCPLEAKSCAEITSPFGCDCETRKKLDKQLGKKEFDCDKIPSGFFFFFLFQFC